MEKPENFGDYVAAVWRVAIDLERGRGRGYWPADMGSHDTRMDWETALEVRISSASGTHAKRVSKDVIKARKSKGLCLHCGNIGYRIRECTYLPPIGLEARVSTARSDSSIGLGAGLTGRVGAVRARQVREVLNELDSSNFDNE